MTVLANLLVTDFALYADENAEIEAKSANPDGYVQDARVNRDWLIARGVVPQGGWDLFRAGKLWRQHSRVPPSLVLIHGLHYNTADDSSRCAEGEFENSEFKACAAAALQAQFPGIPLLFLHIDANLAFPCEPGTLLMRVTPGSGIDNWALGSQFPEELLSTLVCGRIGEARHYIKECEKGEHIDVLEMVTDALLAGRKVLQLSCNRCQFSRRIVEALQEKEEAQQPDIWRQGPRDRRLPLREFYEFKERTLYRFTYDELIDWGTERGMLPLHLAAYWRTGHPVDDMELPMGAFPMETD